MKITPIDERRADDGAWFDYMGVPLKIARSNNPNFKKVFRRLSKPYDKKLREHKLDPDTSEKLVCRSLAEAVLLDWDGEKLAKVIGEKDPIPYSADVAEELLLNDVDCREFVQDTASEAENYYKQETERKLGNSSAPSNGK